jgi:CDP-2,3-bis-(O-geranylgeranyl)-sn-glycerol synthase
MSFWHLALQCMYLLLPAAFANMAPVLFKNSFKWLAVPIDFGKTWRGKPIFGPHKTVRGFIVGIKLAVIVALIQAWLSNYPTMQEFSLVDFSQGYGFAILFGALMGFGSLFGDLVKSFFKRRIGVDAGKPFIPFDEIDFAIGALLFSALVVPLSWHIAVMSLSLAFIFHILTNHLAFYLGIRKEKW